MIIGKEYRFEAAHRLPETCEDHPCREMHGHSYKVLILIDGPLQPNGMVMDYHEINKIVKPLIEQLDHSVLNEIVENPTAENLAIYLFDKLFEFLPMAAVEVRETETSLARFSAIDHQMRSMQN